MTAAQSQQTERNVTESYTIYDAIAALYCEKIPPLLIPTLLQKPCSTALAFLLTQDSQDVINIVPSFQSHALSNVPYTPLRSTPSIHRCDSRRSMQSQWSGTTARSSSLFVPPAHSNGDALNYISSSFPQYTFDISSTKDSTRTLHSSGTRDKSIFISSFATRVHKPSIKLQDLTVSHDLGTETQDTDELFGPYIVSSAEDAEVVKSSRESILSSDALFDNASVVTEQPSRSRTETLLKFVEVTSDRINAAKPIGYRSPCPYCNDSFVAMSEMRKHVLAVHERPVEYICRHHQSSNPFRSCDKTFCLTQAKRHHYRHHKDCEFGHNIEAIGCACIEKKLKLPTKRLWGCHFCERAVFTNITDWTTHHMQHQLSRSSMSSTNLVRSLLTYENTRLLWEQAALLYESELGFRVRYVWNGERSKDLIEALETGIYDGIDFWSNILTEGDLVNAVLDAAIKEQVLPFLKCNTSFQEAGTIKRQASTSPDHSLKHGVNMYKRRHLLRLHPNSSRPVPSQQNLPIRDRSIRYA